MATIAYLIVATAVAWLGIVLVGLGPCKRLPPFGKEVVDPVGLTLIVQTIYEAFVGISSYEQPSENAGSRKCEREKEKNYRWCFAR